MPPTPARSFTEVEISRGRVVRAGLLAVLWAADAPAPAAGAQTESKAMKERVFEMRTYYAAPGKMEALHARFREHTCKLF
jgi:hypothetical protein